MTITGVFLTVYDAPMPIWDSVLVALFCVAGVFVVLIALSLIVKLISSVLHLVSNKEKSEPISKQQPSSLEQHYTNGNLILKDVDETTAALIMAIVSDESGVPLHELQFMSIKQLRND
ncbi:MAG: OadG family protein [Clostridiales bacterium]|nr:OadG family protein [Clostridiales bacterium]